MSDLATLASICQIESSGEEERKEIYYLHCTPVERGKVSTSAHLPGTDLCLRFKYGKNWGRGGRFAHKQSQAKCGLAACYLSTGSAKALEKLLPLEESGLLPMGDYSFRM
jgi:hypothetical protein